MRRARGFTLMELLVVMGIIMVVMGISVPSLLSFARGQRLKQSGNTISGALAEARSISVTQRRPVRVFFFHDPKQDLYGVGTYYVDRMGEDRLDTKLFNKGVEIEHTGYETPYSNVFILDKEVKANLFTENGMDGNSGKVEYLRDGTVEFYPDYVDIPPALVDGKDLYDRNSFFERVSLGSTEADIILKQKSGSSRCFIDIDPNSGRAFSRVVETGP